MFYSNFRSCFYDLLKNKLSLRFISFDKKERKSLPYLVFYRQKNTATL